MSEGIVYEVKVANEEEEDGEDLNHAGESKAAVSEVKEGLKYISLGKEITGNAL